MENRDRQDWRERAWTVSLNRRNLVRRGVALGLGAPVAVSLLAACGGNNGGGNAPTAASGGAGTTPTSAITVNQNATATTAPPPSGSVSTGSPSPGAKASPTAPAAVTKAPVGKAGGSVKLARQQDSNNLDPVTNDGNVNIWVFMSIYDQLIKVDEKGTGLLPGLAEKWDVSTDGLNYTFNIRKGVKFSDGAALMMDDVKWSIERAKNTADSIWKFTLDQVSSVDIVDDATIKIVLTQKWAPFLSDISMFNASIISRAFGEGIGVDKLVDQTMGTGPFMLKEWRKRESITLVKNPNYWEPGLPLLDEIIMPVVPDGNSQILQLQGGDIDGIIGQGDVPFNRVNDLSKDSNLQVLRFTSTYVNFLALNTRNAPLNDVKVRQALNYATNKQALIDTILFGNGEISNSFMPNGALYWNPDQKPYEYNVETAKQLLSQSTQASGFKVSYQVVSGNQQALAVATAIKDMWSQINVNVDILQLDQAVARDNYRNSKFEINATGWTNDIIDPDELVSYAILPEQTENYKTGWVNQQAIDLANQGRATTDDAARRKIYYQIQQIHKDDAPFVYLWVQPYIDVLSTKIKGFFHNPMGQYDFRNTSLGG